ncbi:MAG: ABC transporter permease subunit [Patescibacteria group bacterium]|nr:ABC transporter permease subunit [Patescibacteria group bacterium]
MRAHHSPQTTRVRHSSYMHYPRTESARVWEFFILPALILAALSILLRFSGFFPATYTQVSLSDVGIASAFTVGRLLIAYICAVICAVPLALLATHSAILQRFLLPLFDLLQSVPILAFFPVVIVLFLNIGSVNSAAIFILFLSMLWNIVFALIGGVGLIPRDIIYAAEVFGIRGVSYFTRVIIPAIVPQMVVGSILAMAQGWNIIIVAEVVRTYLPATSPIQNLFGLGSMLVYASSHGQDGLFLAALTACVCIIAIINFFVWQRLLKYAQRFKFE